MGFGVSKGAFGRARAVLLFTTTPWVFVTKCEDF
jgi:hypothetical protein